MVTDTGSDAAAPAAADWWVRHGDEVFGPYSAEEMRGFVAEGRVRAETEIRQAENAAWVPAGRQPDLASAFTGHRAPPPRPELTREQAPDLRGVPGGASAPDTGPIGISEHDLGRAPLPPGETTTLAHVVYGLFVLGVFTVGLAGIIGVIIAALKRRDVRGTWLETHYRWQIRTFWVLLFGWVVAAIIFRFAIGVILPSLLMLWALWRVLKGWTRLGSSRPIDDPTAWF